MTASPRYKFDHSAVQRDCALYAIDVLDPNTGRVVEGDYIGETARLPFVRFMEHLYDQPFGDLIVGHPRLLGAYGSKDEVLAAEKAAVESMRPRLNYEWNRGNTRRIEVWRQRADRARRDAAKGVPSRWMPDGQPNPAFVVGGSAPPRPRAPFVPQQRPRAAAGKPAVTPAERALKHPLTWWALTWVALSGGLWWGLVRVMGEAGWVLPAEWGAGLSAIGAVVALVWARREARRLRRKWKRMWR